MTSTQRAGIAAREQALSALRSRPRAELALGEGPSVNVIEWIALTAIRRRVLLATVRGEVVA